MRCAGINIPVFSLRSKKGLGSGEFLDLIPLIDWCKEAGLKVIQILPVYDLIYLNIHALAPELDEEIKPLAKILNQPKLDYRKTYLAKKELLKMLFMIRGEKDLSSKAFEQFFKKVDKNCEEEDAEFFYFVQFHLHKQLKEVVRYAEDQGITLIRDYPKDMQDLPIVSERKPRNTEMTFEDTRDFPEKSICTPSTDDMAPLRAWWEEDEEKTALYYHTILKRTGQPPKTLSSEVAHQIIQDYLNSKSKFAIFLLQDLLAMNDALKFPEPKWERINDPDSNWNWRCHIYIEEFLLNKSFSKQIREMVRASKR